MIISGLLHINFQYNGLSRSMNMKDKHENKMRKVALITGITGQDGSFLAEFLLEKGYDVHGTIRRSSVDFRERIAHLEGHPAFHLHYADLGDSTSLSQVVKRVKPTEIYNLAAQSHVQVSFDSPEFTADVDATGVLRILEAVRQMILRVLVVFTKPLLPNYMGRWRRFLRMRKRLFIRIAPMRWRSCMVIGS